MNPSEPVKCFEYQATIPAKCCALRYLKRRESFNASTPVYPECARCERAEEIVVALRKAGWEPPKHIDISPDTYRKALSVRRKLRLESLPEYPEAA